MFKTQKTNWSRLAQWRLLFILVGGIVALVIWLPAVSGSLFPRSNCDCLVVQFLDVGQGDAVLIQTPDGVEMLVDGGRDATVLRELSKGRSFFDRTIDVVVATHPDADHISGLVDVLARYQVATIIQTENAKETAVTSAFAQAVESENARVMTPDAGQVLWLGEQTRVVILSPKGDETNWESNTASIVMYIEYGDTSFLLTGDAPSGIENYLVGQYGKQLQSDVLKLGHHGSKTSTSELFLDTVKPTYAVVSASIDNRYGHPHQEVMQRVFARNIQTSQTGTDGTITFYSDGETVWQEE
jgi:competence protein ComEC